MELPTHCSALFLPPGTPALFNRYPAPPNRVHRGSFQELQPEPTGGWSGEDILWEAAGMNSCSECSFSSSQGSKGVVLWGLSFSESVRTLIHQQWSPKSLKLGPTVEGVRRWMGRAVTNSNGPSGPGLFLLQPLLKSGGK